MRLFVYSDENEETNLLYEISAYRFILWARSVGKTYTKAGSFVLIKQNPSIISVGVAMKIWGEATSKKRSNMIYKDVSI